MLANFFFFITNFTETRIIGILGITNILYTVAEYNSFKKKCTFVEIESAETLCYSSKKRL